MSVVSKAPALAVRAATAPARLLSFCLVLLSTPSILIGTPQEPSGLPFVERLDVELVLVDVLATDRTGRAVLDLGPDEFWLFVDGRSTAISQFSAPRAPRNPAGPEGEHRAEPRPGRLGRVPQSRYAIFIDEFNLSFGSRRTALIQLTETLGALPSDSEVLLATFDGGTRVDVAFTRDHGKVQRALGEKLRTAPPGLVDRFAEERLLDWLPRALQIGLQTLGTRDLDEVCSAYLLPVVRSHAEQTWGRVEQSVAALTSFVASLSGFSGPKVLLYVSDGLPLVAGQVGFEYAIELCDGTLAQQGGIRSVIPELEEYEPATVFPSSARAESQGYNTVSLWRRLSAHANTNRVIFYALQASGIEAPWASDVSGSRASERTGFFDRMNDRDTLSFMAAETGGRAIFNTNDFRPLLARMVEDSALRYELAFVPDPMSEGRMQSIRVEVQRDGLRVHHRKSFRYRTPDEQAIQRLFTTLLHGVEQNPLRARLEAEASGRRRRGEAEVLVEFSIPLEALTLLPSDAQLRGQIGVLLAAQDERGNRTGVGEKTLTLEIAAGDSGEQYRYEVSMFLPVGHEYRIAAAIRDLLSGAASYRTAEVSLFRE